MGNTTKREFNCGGKPGKEEAKGSQMQNSGKTNMKVLTYFNERQI